MQVDLVGRIRNTKLPESHGLQPVFEAIINSIDAIEEAEQPDGEIIIRLRRDLSLLTEDVHGNTIPDLDMITVIDNGIGFTEKNFRSFETVDTTAKASRGGKGVGRILWLKAFDWAEVRSVFREGERLCSRRFEFRPTDSGIERHELTAAEAIDAAPGTTVVLHGFRERYRTAVPKSPETLARRIVEHCLQFFLMDRVPNFILDDADLSTRIDLNQLFNDDYQPRTTTRTFTLAGHEFVVKDVLLKPDKELQHQLFFCANDRPVREVTLSGRIPHLPATVQVDGLGDVVYNAYISSAFLDARVDPDRTDFTIDRRGDLPLSGGATWEDVVGRTLEFAEGVLGPLTERAREDFIRRVSEFVADNPRYRGLLTHRRQRIERLPGDISDEKLDIELHKALSDWKTEVRTRTVEQLSEDAEGDHELSYYHERFSNLVDELQEIAVAELAEYVVHRRAILEFFQRMLGRKEDGKFPREDALHELLFPRRKSSDDVDYDDHNLWILDERFAYHAFLASDQPLVSHGGPIESLSRSRPDLLIYNRPIAFSDNGLTFSSVAIVEFKKPERGDYADAENPIRQVLEYVNLLHEGKARRPDGSTINIPPTMPFYCYVVATLTPRLRKEADIAGFTPAPDGEGYFHFNPNYRAYIEVISYHKALTDAKRRNRAFFDRLQIPTS